MIQCDLLDTKVDPGIRRYRARFCIECLHSCTLFANSLAVLVYQTDPPSDE